MKARSLMYSFFLTIAVGTTCPSAPLIAADDSGTLSAAEHTIRCWAGPHIELLYGYMRSRSLGSYSPTNLTGGQILAEIYDQTDGGCKLVSGATLSISEFPADPGRGWLTSVTCNGIKLSESAVARFSFGGSTATWQWNRRFGFDLSAGRPIGCKITHS